MEQGIVKWFSNEKGFGFIQRKDGDADVFVRHTAIKMKGYRTLVENQPVAFELGASPKGLIAINVIPQEYRNNPNSFERRTRWRGELGVSRLDSAANSPSLEFQTSALSLEGERREEVKNV